MEKNRGKDELGREDENDKNKMELTDELRGEEEFKKFDLRKKERIRLLGSSLEVEACTESSIIVRMTSMQKATEISIKLEEEDAAVAGAMLDVQNVEAFLCMNGYVGIRHNVYNWKTSKVFLRLYRDPNSEDYEVIDIQVTKDYIVVHPKEVDSEDKHKGSADANSESQPGTSRLVPIVQRSSLYDIKIRFHRKKENICTCQNPHHVKIHAVLGKDVPMDDLEEQMSLAGLEEAAESVSVVPASRSNIYETTFGKFPKNARSGAQVDWINEKWTQVSYLQLNREPSGYVELKRVTAPEVGLRLACDGSYLFIKLRLEEKKKKKNSAEDDPIFLENGICIKPVHCPAEDDPIFIGNGIRVEPVHCIV